MVTAVAANSTQPTTAPMTGRALAEASTTTATTKWARTRAVIGAES